MLDLNTDMTEWLKYQLTPPIQNSEQLWTQRAKTLRDFDTNKVLNLNGLKHLAVIQAQLQVST